MKKSVLKNYARLAVRTGVNLQKGQDVVITGNVENAQLVTYIVEEAYKAGARHVEVDWVCDPIQRIAMKKGKTSVLSEVPEWKKVKMQSYVDNLPCRIYIDDSDPDTLAGINPQKVATVYGSIRKAMKPYREQMENKYQWSILGAPSVGWAHKVFPELSKKQAVNKLWEAILRVSRADNDDPCAAWDKFNKDLAAKSSKLNSLNVVKLHYTSKKSGTDFKVGLLPNTNWLAGGEVTLGSNIFFNPNIPSEECFISPRSGDAEGIVYSSKPLAYNGQIIDKFWIKFEGGKAVDCHAEVGEDVLKHMIATDEGSCKLGECALVPFSSPINKEGFMFYSTLYDENAVCHLALGMGFTNTVKDYEKYTQDELHQMGINDSVIHVDFMIGTEDLSIVGTTKDGKEVQIFKNGEWAF